MSAFLFRAFGAGGLLALVLLACEPVPDEEPLPCRNLEAGVADLGAGDLDSGYQELVDGDEITIVFGPQGMHMVTVSSRVIDLEPAQAGGIGNEVSLAVRVGGEVVGGVVSDMEPASQVGEVSDFLGIRGVFTEAEVDRLYGELAEVEVVVRDGCGRDLTAQRELRLMPAQ